MQKRTVPLLILTLLGGAAFAAGEANWLDGFGTVGRMDGTPDSTTFLRGDGTWATPTGSGGAPTDATYLTQTANGTLTAEQAMGALATGLVRNTTTTGVQSIYGGTSCTNQFPRSLDASGAATCASVADTDLTSNYSGTGDCGAGSFARTLNDNAAPTCATDDDVPEAADLGAITGGAGLTHSPTGTLTTASGETDFLASGALTCGASTQGRTQVHTTPLQYCDNTATPTLRYAAYGSSTGVATSATALAANGANCSGNNFALGVDASGVGECAQPAFSNLSGTATDAQLASNYSGVGACAANTWASTLTDNAAPTCTQPGFSNLSGSASIAQGGTTETASTEDAVLVGASTTDWAPKVLPSCSNGTTDKLLYNSSTNAFSCGADQTAGGGPTLITGASGAANSAAAPSETWQVLTSNCAANSTTTIADCMTTTSLPAGTYQFRYDIIAQAGATTTALKFDVDYSGTVTSVVYNLCFPSAGVTAATGVADQAQNTTTGQVWACEYARADATTLGPHTDVDTANANVYYTIEGIIIVSTSADLALGHASEVAASSQVMAGTILHLRRFN